MTSKTVVERIAEAAWVALNFDNDPHDGQPHNTHAWNALTAAIRKAMRQDETTDKPVAWTVEASHDKSLCQPFLLRQDAVMYAGNKRHIHPGITWTLVPLYRSPVEPTYNPETVAAIKAALVAGGKVVCCQQFPDCECEPEKASDE